MYKSLAFLQGYYAFHDLLFKDDNPYENNIHPQEWEDWSNGFQKAWDAYKIDTGYYDG